jgi:hypothetical protein
MDYYSGRIALYDSHMGVTTLLIRHRLNTTLSIGTMMPAALHELVGIPDTGIGNPAGYIAGTAPEDKPVSAIVKTDDYVGMIAYPPGSVPLRAVFEIRIAGSKTPWTGRS